MKKLNLIPILTLLMITVLMTGCEVVGDIFKAGIWVGIIGVALLVGLVIWIIGKMK